MKPEKFFEAFTELDDDLIENAFSKTQEPEIVRPAERVFSWKPFATAAALVFLAGGITVGGMKLYNSRKVLTEHVDSAGSQESSVSSKITQNMPVNYSYVNVDYEVYNSVRELVSKSDIIVTGKVMGISFELHDLHTGELLTEYNEDAELCTVYDVDIVTSYKGSEEEKVRIIMWNGLKDYEVDKQLELVGEHYIPVLEDPVDINTGEEYLFVLSQSMSQSGTGNTMTCLVNNSQGVFRTDQPTVKERFSQASLNDIVDYLTNNDNKSDVISVIHNGQSVALSEQSSVALTDAVMQLLTTGGLSEVQSTITEQDIKEYGKNGYAIMIRDYDIDEPLFEGAYDKKARVISDVTVLIGGEDEPSYLTYSYTVFSTDGASENYNGGTFALNESSRDNILQILNP